MATKEQIENILYDVLDPELQISLMDLGLIYDVKVEEQKVIIEMTLTTLGCPLFDTIQEEIEMKFEKNNIPPEQLEIKLTFDPPWSMERMSERAKAMLGI
jgi:metal-sulfur cluster biosynthetic enzyme